jgi:hypothetical protein
VGDLQRGCASAALNQENAGVYLNYIILAHKAPQQVARLVRRLEQPAARFFIHVDKKADFAAFKRALDGLSFVMLLENRVECAWADFSIVEATNRCIDAVLRAGNRGPVILMSGQDYPLRSNSEILQFFADRPGRSFIEMKAITKKDTGFFAGHHERLDLYRFNLSSERHDFVLLPPLFSRYFWRGQGALHIIKGFLRNSANRRYLLSATFRREIAIIRKPRVQPIPMEHYGGQQWWALDWATLASVRAFLLAHPELDAFHMHTQVPDELYYHSTLMHLAKTTPSLVLAPQVTYANWHRKDARPAIFTSSDADKAELASSASNYLFARKFDAMRDAAILDWLDARALSPAIDVRDVGTLRGNERS